MRRLDVQVPTVDGKSDATLHLPDGDGPWPGVVIFPDAVGVRDVFRGMAGKLANLGYAVLLPDVYYREGEWGPLDIATTFGTPEGRARLGELMGSLTNDRIIADTGSYADFLLARPEVAGSAIGTTGYCMGGRMSLVAATGLGDKIAAAASFHGGMLAMPDDPASPHLAADGITATVYVAGAKDDDYFTTEQADLLRQALDRAGVDHRVEFYAAHHGFAVEDNPTFDEAASAQHWENLDQFYRNHLQPS